MAVATVYIQKMVCQLTNYILVMGKQMTHINLKVRENLEDSSVSSSKSTSLYGCICNIRTLGHVTSNYFVSQNTVMMIWS